MAYVSTLTRIYFFWVSYRQTIINQRMQRREILH